MILANLCESLTTQEVGSGDLPVTLPSLYLLCALMPLGRLLDSALVASSSILHSEVSSHVPLHIIEH